MVLLYILDDGKLVQAVAHQHVPRASQHVGTRDALISVTDRAAAKVRPSIRAHARASPAHPTDLGLDEGRVAEGAHAADFVDAVRFLDQHQGEAVAVVDHARAGHKVHRRDLDVAVRQLLHASQRDTHTGGATAQRSGSEMKLRKVMKVRKERDALACGRDPP